MVKSIFIDREKGNFLVGNKWYSAKNDSKQGPGNDTIGPDFNFYNTDFPDYPSQSFYFYPNNNFYQRNYEF